MAKRKKVTTGYEREVEISSRGSTWTIDGVAWLWTGDPGLNTAILVENAWCPIVYSKNLKDAGLFSEGFMAGLQSTLKKS